MFKTFISCFSVFACLFTAAGSYACNTACPLPHTTPWEKLVEKSFGLQKGLGGVLMTQEQWDEHKQKMFKLTAQERERYKRSVHLQLVEKAKEEGLIINVPERDGVSKGNGLTVPSKYLSKGSAKDITDIPFSIRSSSTFSRTE